jgi:DNA modification methylase
MRRVTGPGWELICGDAREALAVVRGAGLLLTDPPYKLTTGGHTGEMRGKFDPSRYANDGGIVPCDIEWTDWPALAYAAMANNADAYVMAEAKNIWACDDAMRAGGFDFHNLLAWDKTTATANRWYMKNLEYVWYGWKGSARTINDAGSKQLVAVPPPRNTQHPTEKPVALMQHYIMNSTGPGATVLDPFAGSGTTVVAAIACGRRFIGIEKDARYFDLAVRRMEAVRPLALARFTTGRAPDTQGSLL